MRFVPFATVEGKPKKLSMDKVTTDPLPATVLIAPATKPASIISGVNCQSYSVKIFSNGVVF